MRTFIIKSKRKIFIILFWILIWHIISLKINNKILLPEPLIVGKTLYKLLGKRYFWKSIFNSCLKIGFGYILGIVSGLLLGIISFKNKIFKELIEFPINIIQSIPLASFIVILLIWFNARELSTIIVAIVVLPIIYYGTINSLENVDKNLLEMAKVFNTKLNKVIKYIYFPKIIEILTPSVIVSSGLAWRSGISGEVFGLVKDSIGENIYYSKLYLDTEELFAWTITIILLSKVFIYFFKLITKKGENK